MFGDFLDENSLTESGNDISEVQCHIKAKLTQHKALKRLETSHFVLLNFYIGLKN